MRAVCNQIEQLRPNLDGGVRPCGVKVSIWLYPDGRLREIETAPVFKAVGARR